MKFINKINIASIIINIIKLKTGESNKFIFFVACVVGVDSSTITLKSLIYVEVNCTAPSSFGL